MRSEWRDNACFNRWRPTSTPIPFDDRAARAFGRVAAQLRASGRKTTARAYDALIAATAVANDLPVYTRNPDEFAGIESLTVVTMHAGQ